MSLHSLVARANQGSSSNAGSAAIQEVLAILRPSKLPQPRFSGPSSPAFCLNAVKTKLNQLESGSESGSLTIESRNNPMVPTVNSNAESEGARSAYGHGSEQLPFMVKEGDGSRALELLQTIGVLPRTCEAGGPR
jgi:hypothetical protein